MALPPLKDQPIGMKVGNYVITKAIGAGGMGAVYLAEHPEIGRKVAVKLLPRHLGLTPGLADRFRAEARAVTRIEHPNIIEIYDYGQTDNGQLYYIMELLTGHELIDDIRQLAPMSGEQVAPYVEQICAALQAAHDSGVVHRDLKPENIFVLDRPELTIKVLDFGLAKLLNDPDPEASQTQTGQIMGTPLTIAPEQAAGRPQEIGPQTDIYSLGVILYWMMAGNPPFEEETTALLLAKHISEAAPPLLAKCPSAPVEITSVVDRCLNKAPADRPASAMVIYSRFAAALDSSEPTAFALNPALDKTPLAELPEPTIPPTATTQMSGSTPSLMGELASIPGMRPSRDRNLIFAAAALLLVLGVGAFLLTRTGEPETPDQPPVTSKTMDTPEPSAASLAPSPLDAGPAQVAATLDAKATTPAVKPPAPAKKPRRARKVIRQRKAKRRGATPVTPAKRSAGATRGTSTLPLAPPPPKPAVKPAKPTPPPPMGESTVPLEL